MAIKKREQIVIVAISAVVAIFLVHMLIFRTRANEYNEVVKSYEEGVAKLQGAEFISSSVQLDNFKKKTKEYESLITSVTASLNIDYTANFSGSTPKEIFGRLAETTGLLTRLTDMRRSQLQQGRASTDRPALTFLDNRTDPRYPGVQFGWNLPLGLPAAQKDAIWDNVVKLADRYELLRNIPKATQQMEQRYQYNLLLSTIGIAAGEVSDYVWFYNNQTPIFFSDPKLVPQLPGARPNDYYGLLRMGPIVPRLKKLRHYELLLGVRDPQSPVTDGRLAIALELTPEYFPYDVTLSHVNRQLRALIDIIQLAKKNDIVEIYQVNLMKPAQFAKVELRVPGAEPTPTPTPDPSSVAARTGGTIGGGRSYAGAQGGADVTPIPADQKIGTGIGIEISFRGTNINIVILTWEPLHAPILLMICI
jgi:hypothetical protein